MNLDDIAESRSARTTAIKNGDIGKGSNPI
jgi:hypothetical protein